VTTEPSECAETRRPKSRIVSLRVDEHDFVRLDALARRTSCSRGEVLRRCLRGARLRSTVDALFKLGSCLLHQGDSVFTQTIMNLCAAGERLKKR